MGIIIDAINFILDGMGEVIIWVVSLLPDSPFAVPSKPPSSVNLGYVTWLIPFPTMIAHFMLLLTAIVAWYGVRVLARWIKAARS